MMLADDPTYGCSITWDEKMGREGQSPMIDGCCNTLNRTIIQLDNNAVGTFAFIPGSTNPNLNCQVPRYDGIVP